ncbi:FKBP-type peptidyl-prolyl cis-trans isomerase [Reichenbachiella agarivorans]|uniref:Peptidyl-prolyl cis-trans isomerase n=1 Tax=Reichenbachiella agarivorans TaxID=2979464 RepID=A0ABY6CUA7_9BACT|nr:FKBP-type peptidyl-prolyl cis-trans isomerase [Reichenbachiella agarivorans]UXP33919.1 FKBP-type peptidyl-prolyl cis-trans isomerase [Reichenbachiella agarivorans]
MIDKKVRAFVFWSVLVMVGLMASCSNPVKDEEEEIERAYQDSLAQAAIDDEIIENYLDAQGYSGVESTDDGIRYVVTQSGNGSFPKINDIVSVDFVGKLPNGDVFDTTVKEVAITTDSAAWVAAGVDVSGLMTDTGQSIDVLIDSLQYYDGSLDYNVFSILKNYVPLTYNYTSSGSGIPSGYITGFKTGLRLLTPQIDKESESMTIFPSAVGYATVDNVRIPANSVLIFEFTLTNIRP